MMETYDVIIIGGGIAGASLAYRLAPERSVLLLEAEDQPGRHATGRSAAFYSETYGNETIRGLTSASKDFYNDPPQGFSETPLLEPSGALFIGRADQLDALKQHYEAARALVPSIELHDGAFALSKVQVLDPAVVAGCVWEPDSQAINVHELLTGFVQGARKAGASLVTDARVERLTQEDGSWTVSTAGKEYAAPVVVNAAGAWAGEIGKLAGAVDIGLEPMRRSVCVIDPAKAGGIEGDIAHWPLVIEIEEAFYFKPSGGAIWLSPADETPSPPCDAQPEDIDLAMAIDNLEKTTSIRVRRIEHKWAGLRSFTADRTPVAGFDPDRPGFFWLAGQGGYGIQTSPALSAIAAALIIGKALPQEVTRKGIDLAALSPERFSNN